MCANVFDPHVPPLSIVELPDDNENIASLTENANKQVHFASNGPAYDEYRLKMLARPKHVNVPTLSAPERKVARPTTQTEKPATQNKKSNDSKELLQLKQQQAELSTKMTQIELSLRVKDAALSEKDKQIDKLSDKMDKLTDLVGKLVESRDKSPQRNDPPTPQSSKINMRDTGTAVGNSISKEIAERQSHTNTQQQNNINNDKENGGAVDDEFFCQMMSMTKKWTVKNQPKKSAHAQSKWSMLLSEAGSNGSLCGELDALAMKYLHDEQLVNVNKQHISRSPPCSPRQFSMARERVTYERDVGFSIATQDFIQRNNNNNNNSNNSKGKQSQRDKHNRTNVDDDIQWETPSHNYKRYTPLTHSAPQNKRRISPPLRQIQPHRQYRVTSPQPEYSDKYATSGSFTLADFDNVGDEIVRSESEDCQCFNQRDCQCTDCPC